MGQGHEPFQAPGFDGPFQRPIEPVGAVEFPKHMILIELSGHFLWGL